MIFRLFYDYNVRDKRAIDYQPRQKSLILCMRIVGMHYRSAHDTMSHVRIVSAGIRRVPQCEWREVSWYETTKPLLNWIIRVIAFHSVKERGKKVEY